MKNYVWYASYGSNLYYKRFKLYIEGGTEDFVDREYKGCTNKELPRKSGIIKKPYKLYFSKKASHWSDMGVAFIDNSKAVEKNEYTLFRIYKITLDQFVEIIQQENGIDPDYSKLEINIHDIVKRKEYSIGLPNEFQWYGRILHIGNKDGLPIFTFTAKWVQKDIDVNRPSKEYLTTIMNGIIESNNYNQEDLFEYFISKDGVNNNIKSRELYEIIDTLKNWPKYTIMGTFDRSRVNGDFTVQVHPKAFGDKIIKCNYVQIRNDNWKVLALLDYDKYLDPNTIRVDQKLRNAIGVEKEDKVYLNLKPEHKLTKFSRIIKKRFGVQYNIARVYRSTHNDMEINICRISQEFMKSIGVNDGDVIKVESPYSTIQIRAFELSEKIEGIVRKRIKNDKLKMENPNCASLLKIEQGDEDNLDLAKILIDNDARNKLRVEICDPVRISRSIKNDIVKKLHFLSAPLIFAVVGGVLSIETLVWVEKIIILGVSVILVLILNFIDVKKLV